MHKQTKATRISDLVRELVWERDSHCCVYCGSPYANPEAHFIPRSKGGVGNDERNILTLCRKCHDAYDRGTNRLRMRSFFETYLRSCYPDWDEKMLVYRKE